jgi:hypothetical protein
MTDNRYDMDPLSGERVEVDGTYRNEWGREVELSRGQAFPADPALGTTEWKLIEYDFENHHDGRTDPRLVPKKDEIERERGQITHPRRHFERKDR